MNNPFKFGEVIGSSKFCNRTEELETLGRHVTNCNKVFLYSERRFGKTSRVKLLLSKLDKRQFLCVYVDCWPTHSLAEFTTALSGAMVKDFLSTVEKAVDLSEQLFSSVKAVSVKVGPDGIPSYGLDPKKLTTVEKTIEEVLAIPQHTAERTKKTVVVVLDEIQQIMTYESTAVERHLRSVIQTQGNVAYLFLGSRKHLMKELILSESRPLYRAGSHFPLFPISNDHWIPFIKEKFSEAKKTIGDEEIRYLLEFSESHPNTTQQFCYEVWESVEPNDAVTKERIAQSIKMIIKNESAAQGASWRELDKAEQELLKKLAHKEVVDEPNSETTKALYRKDIVDFDENQVPYVVDRIQKLWIKEMFPVPSN